VQHVAFPQPSQKIACVASGNMDGVTGKQPADFLIIGNRVGYIKSGPDPQRAFFDEKRSYYMRYGIFLNPLVDLDAL
ncbi:hypothetical protein ACC724_40075, partial [Rhizobium ruizarguesonis]